MHIPHVSKLKTSSLKIVPTVIIRNQEMGELHKVTYNKLSMLQHECQLEVNYDVPYFSSELYNL